MLDYLSVCLICNRASCSSRAIFCNECFSDLSFAGYLCDLCGDNLDESSAHTSRFEKKPLCNRCLVQRSGHIIQKRFLIKYFGGGRDFILRLKNRDEEEYSLRKIAELICRRHKDYLLQSDIIVPVPRHWMKVFIYGVGAAFMIAELIAEIIQIEFVVGKLKASWIQSQGIKNPKDRILNVKGAFRTVGAKFSGKKVLLIDDVLTTGATSNECAKALKLAGSKEIRLFTVAKT